jgi:hypothetical protein
LKQKHAGHIRHLQLLRNNIANLARVHGHH